MENVTITDEQFATLIETIRGPQITHTPMQEDIAIEQAALEILQTAARQRYYKPEDYIRLNKFLSDVAALCKEHI
jgi:hypothetical protein